jgi:hypothetical protein
MTEQISDRPPGVPGGFLIGEVFNRSFGVFGRNFLLLFTIAAIVTSPSLYFEAELTAFTTPGNTPATLGGDFWLAVIGCGLAGTIVEAVAQALVFQAAFQDLRGRAVSLRDALSAVVARLAPILVLAIILGALPLIMISIVTGAGVWIAATAAATPDVIDLADQFQFVPAFSLGILFLAVAASVVWILAAVALPACLIEALDPIAAFRRSMALTKGYRWRIFVALSVVGGIGWPLSAAFTAIITLIVGTVAAEFLTFLMNALLIAFNAVLTIVIYHDLRVAKEGVEAE